MLLETVCEFMRFGIFKSEKKSRFVSIDDWVCSRAENFQVTYLPGAFAYQRRERQRHLWETHKFVCACRVCSLTKVEAKASDIRRGQLNMYQESTSNYDRPEPEEALLTILKALALLKEEGYYADSDEFTNVAGQICAYHSDWISARYFAYHAYRTRVEEFGEDNDCSKSLEKYVVDPRAYEGAGEGERRDFSGIRMESNTTASN